jgi:hypothetical protein
MKVFYRGVLALLFMVVLARHVIKTEGSCGERQDQVVTTLFPLYDFIATSAGTRLMCNVPSPGMEAPALSRNPMISSKPTRPICSCTRMIHGALGGGYNRRARYPENPGSRHEPGRTAHETAEGAEHDHDADGHGHEKDGHHDHEGGSTRTSGSTSAMPR